MISKEDLKQIIELMTSHHDRTQDAYKLNIDLIEYNDSLYKVIDILFDNVFLKNQKDFLEWYMYDKDFGRREDLKVWDDNGKEIEVNSIDDFYNTLKDFK